MAVTDERWIDVPTYEGIYQVSTEGRVRSLPRRRRTGAGVRTVRERILRPKPGEYPAVSLARLGDRKTFYVHALVLSGFVGSAPAGMEACHGDGDKWNCRLSNLRWDTPSGNHADRVKHGVSNRGERCGTAKLTARQVAEIRARGDEPRRVLAAAFGVSPAQISQIVHGKRWAYGSR